MLRPQRFDPLSREAAARGISAARRFPTAHAHPTASLSVATYPAAVVATGTTTTASSLELPSGTTWERSGTTNQETAGRERSKGAQREDTCEEAGRGDPPCNARTHSNGFELSRTVTASRGRSSAAGEIWRSKRADMRRTKCSHTGKQFYRHSRRHSACNKRSRCFQSEVCLFASSACSCLQQ
jgi:hypothetical protein